MVTTTVKKSNSRRRRILLIGFALALFLGVAVYFRLWAIDATNTSSLSGGENDPETLRRQFERANLEAMDESAEWRMKYDREVEKSRQCQQELMKVKIAIASANRRSELVQKENLGLQKQVETSTQKTEAKEQRCNCDLSSTQHQ